MKRKDAEALVASIVTMRKGASDELALEAVGIYPEWREGVAYEPGARVRYEGKLYRALTAHESQPEWTPVAAPSLFALVLTAEDGTALPWQQPDSTNAYAKGDRVTHNGSTWQSLTDGNVWEPGATGTESLWQKL